MSIWHRYWFRSSPCVDLAVFRIVTTATVVVLSYYFEIYGDIRVFAEFARLPDDMYAPIPALRVLLLPFGGEFRPSVEFLRAVYYLGMVTGTLSVLGLLTNLSLSIFTICTMILMAHLHSYGTANHGGAPLVIALALLSLSPCGRVLSLDAWWRDRNTTSSGWVALESPLAGWPLLTIQWLFVLMYLSAVVSKLVYFGGLDWLNGFTLQYYLISNSLRRGTLLGMWLAEHHHLVLLAQYGVIIFQTTFVLAVLFPRLRWLYVPAGLAFHLANIVFLNAVFWYWIALYAVFIPWGRLFRMWGPKRSPDVGAYGSTA